MILISMISPSASVKDFKQLNGQFVFAASALIRNITSGNYAKVQLHGYYPGEEGLQ